MRWCDHIRSKDAKRLDFGIGILWYWKLARHRYHEPRMPSLPLLPLASLPSNRPSVRCILRWRIHCCFKLAQRELEESWGGAPIPSSNVSVAANLLQSD